MSRSIRKSLRNKLVHKIIASLALAGTMLTMPSAFAADTDALAAQDIQKAGGAVFNADGVSNIYADQLQNNTASNVFETFKLKDGNIANLWFRTAAGTQYADTLVNLVKSQINIQGTLNGVRNNTIDGNLIFISPEGMVVGADGVINAGSFQMIAPTGTRFNELYNSNGFIYDNFIDKTKSADGQDVGRNLMAAQFPINPEATITVRGNINTTGDTVLRAGAVNLSDNAAIHVNRAIDYKNLVNIPSRAQAGLSGNLNVSKTTEGSIVLSAQHKTSDADTASGLHIGLKDELRPSVTIAENASAIADGDVTITAEAESDHVRSVAVLTPKVTVNGTVQGRHVDIGARAVDTYASVGGDNVLSEVIPSDISAMSGWGAGSNTAGLLIDGIRAFNVDTAFAWHTANAEVSIGKNAHINATGADFKVNSTDAELTGALRIHASSTMNGEVSNNPQTFTGKTLDTIEHQLAKKKEATGREFALIGVAFSRDENKAGVTIESGDVKSAGSLDATAAASYKQKQKVTSTLPKKDDNVPLIGVGVIAGSNKSYVDIKAGAKLDAAGNMKVAADTKNNLSLTVNIKGKQASMGAAAGGIGFISDADVKVAAPLTAGKDISVTAVTTNEKNALSVTSTIGFSELEKWNTKSIITDYDTYIKNATRNLTDSTFAYVKQDVYSTFELYNKAKELFSLGASIGVADETNTATVTLEPAAKLTASASKGSILIDSRVLEQDLSFSAEGATMDAKKDDAEESVQTSTARVSGALLVSLVKDEAKTVIKDGTDAEHAELTAKDITITSENELTSTPDVLINRLEKLFDTAKKTGKLTQEAEKDFLALLNDMKERLKEKRGTQAYKDAVRDFQDKASALSTALGKLEGLLDIPSALLDFAKPGSYANFYTSPATSTGGNGQDYSKLSMAAAVNIALLKDTASVEIGRNTVMDASQGTVKLDTKLSRPDTTINGNYYIDEGGRTAVGAAIAFWKDTQDSLITVSDGVSIKGQAINLHAENDTTHTSVVFGAGKSFYNAQTEAGVTQDNAIEGMVSYVGGSGTAKADAAHTVKLMTTEDTENGAPEAGKNDGSVSVHAKNTATVTNVAGGIAASDGRGIGAAFALNNFNTDSEALLGGTIDANRVSVDAESGGTINVAAVAGGIAKSDAGTVEQGVISKGMTAIRNKAAAIKNFENTCANTLNSAVYGKLSELMEIKKNEMLPTNLVAEPLGNPVQHPKSTIGAAGSAAFNWYDRTTKTSLSDAVVTLHSTKKAEEGTVSAKAADDTFTGAWSGAAGVSWSRQESLMSGSEKGTGIGGAVAVNHGIENVTALMNNSTIQTMTEAQKARVINEAEKSGATAALGVSLGIAKADERHASEYAGAVSASGTIATNNVTASLTDMNIRNAKTLANEALDTDTQVTGGIDLAIAKGGKMARTAAIGGTAAFADITNNITASVSGGSYISPEGTFENTAVTGITQIGTAVGVSAAAGDGKSYGIQGDIAYNHLKNDVKATVGRSDNRKIEITQASLTNSAHDTSLGKKAYDDYLGKLGIDATGQSYSNSVSAELDKLNSSEVYKAGSDGNTIITAALSGAGSTEAGINAAAAIAIADIDNDFTAKISDGTLKVSGSGASDGIMNSAKSDTLLISTAAGVAASKNADDFVGSVSWQTTTDDITAAVENSAVTTVKLTNHAVSAAKEINVAGDVSVGKGAAGGVAIGYNDLLNTTKAQLTGLTGSVSGVIDNAAQNEGKVYNFGVGASVTDKGGAALSGTIVINRGKNDVLAELDGVGTKDSIFNAGGLSVRTTDESIQTAAVGAVEVSMAEKGMGIGGAFAYNEIGTATKDEKKRQKQSAAVRSSHLKLAENAEITAKDTAKVTAVSIGVGAAGTAAINGAAAAEIIRRDVTASVENSELLTEKGSLTVQSESTEQLTTSADVAAAGKNTGFGAGVAVTMDSTKTTADFQGSTWKGKDLEVKAVNRSELHSVGIGIGAGYGEQGTGATGSVSVNHNDNVTDAYIRSGTAAGSTAEASGHVLVKAQSDDIVSNYAGKLDGSVDGQAVGISVLVNVNNSETKASVAGADTKVTAAGAESFAVNDTLPDTEILDKIAQSETAEWKTPASKRTTSSYKGIAVSASGTHSDKAFAINAAVVGKGLAADALVNVNVLGGKTEALVDEALLSGTTQVVSHDYANSSGIVGQLTAGATGIGAASDTNKVTRNVTATFRSRQGAELQMDRLMVEATARQGISSLTAGLAGAGGTAGVDVKNSVTLLDGKTKAIFDGNGSSLKTNALTVSADHMARVHTLDASLAGSPLGAGTLDVSIVKSNGETAAAVHNVQVTLLGDTGEAKIKAKNDQSVSYHTGSGAIAITGAAAAVTGVSSVSGTVLSGIYDSRIVSEKDTAAGKIAVTAENDVSLFNVMTELGGSLQAAAGLGVTVNSISSQTGAHVNNSTLTAQTIDVSAEEKREVKEIGASAAISAQGAGGANVMVTHVGRSLQESYGYAGAKGSGKGVSRVNVKELYGYITDKLSKSYVSQGALHGLKEEEVKAEALTLDSVQESRVTAKAEKSTLRAGNALTVSSKDTTNASLLSANAVGAAEAAVNGTVGILDVAGNVGADILQSSLTAPEIKVLTTQDGTSTLKLYQGTGSMNASVGVAYGQATMTGLNNINLVDSSLDAAKALTAEATDRRKVELEAYGTGVAVDGSLCIIVGEAKNSGNVAVSIEGGSMKSENTTIQAAHARRKDKVTDEKDPYEETLNIKAVVADAGIIASGAGLGAVAKDTETVGVTVTGAAAFSGNKLSIQSINAPQLKAFTTAAGGGFISGAVTVAEASLGTSANRISSTVNIADGAFFDNNVVSLDALNSAKQTMDMYTVSAGIAGVSVHTAAADYYGKTDLTVGAAKYKKGAKLDFRSENKTKQYLMASGVSGAVAASGTNVIKNTNDFLTTLSAGGVSNAVTLGEANMSAVSSEDTTAKVFGHGGGVADVSPLAAKLDKTLVQTTTETLKGAWSFEKALTNTVTNTAKESLTVDAQRAAVVGGSGTELSSTTTSKAQADFTNAAITTGGRLREYTANNLDVTQSLLAGGYGGARAEGAVLHNNVTADALINVTGGSLYSAEDMVLDAENILGGRSESTLKGAGIVNGLFSTGTQVVNLTEKVTIDGAKLKTADGSDLTLAADDMVNQKFLITSSNDGSAFGSVSSHANNTLSRTGSVDVKGSSTLTGGRDLNLYASADGDGKSSDLTLEVTANAYNNGFIPAGTTPSLKDILTQVNTVTAGKYSTLESIRDVNIKAADGTTFLTEESVSKTLWKDKTSSRVASSAQGKTDAKITRTNSVTVEGSVTAGIHNELDLIIDGRAVAEKDEATGVEKEPGLSEIAEKSEAGQAWYTETGRGLFATTITLGNPYLEEYNRLVAAMRDYAPSTAQYQLLASEAKGLLKQMADAGVAELGEDGEYRLLENVMLPAIKVDDITVSGGSVNISTGLLKNPGTLTAKGAPHITIQNKGPVALSIGNITLDSIGGEILLNDKPLEEAENVHAAGSVNKADITISNTTHQAADEYNRPNIYIDGTVTNTNGSIHVKNASGDISVKGTLDGRTVDVDAPNGMVEISAPKGLVNVGGDPISEYMPSEQSAKDTQKKVSDAALAQNSQLTQTYRDARQSETGGSIVAGGDISISGRHVNINGLVQSGYQNYGTYELASERIKTIQEHYDTNGGKNSAGKHKLLDDEVLGNEDYLVSAADRVWNSTTKSYDYAVPVYYNPSTQHLLTGDVNVKGGHIYITGEISSTGNGRLLAATGTATVNIDTAPLGQYDLYVGNITNRERDGLIRITDTLTNTVTEFKDGYQRSYAVSVDAAGRPAWSGTSDYRYTPQAQIFSWTGGSGNKVITDMYYVRHEHGPAGWKWYSTGTTEDTIAQIKQDTEHLQVTTRSVGGDSLLTSGTAITSLDKADKFIRDDIAQQSSSTVNGTLYTSSTVKKDDAVVRSPEKPNESKEYTNWWHTSWDHKYSWSESRGETVSTTYSIYAGNTISAGFLKGSGNVAVHGAGEVIFTGDVKNATNVSGKGIGVLSVVSDRGGIRTTEDGMLYTDNLSVKAARSVDIQQTALGSEALISVKGTDIKVSSESGDLRLGTINGDGHTTDIKAFGSILGQTDGSAVTAKNIMLASETGTIGSAQRPVYTVGESFLSASARGDISLRQKTGDMAVDSIKSKQGNVSLTADTGSIIDANQAQHTATDIQKRIERWTELGFISAEDDKDSHAKADAAAKAAQLSVLRDRANQLALGTDGRLDTGKAAGYEAAANSYINDAGIKAATAAYTSEMRAAVTDAARNAALNKLNAARTDYFSRLSGNYSKEEQQLIISFANVMTSTGGGWSQSELIYAVQDSILNSPPGVLELIDKPNISAKNITMTAAHGIGNDAPETYIKNEDISKNLPTLSTVRAGDLTWDAGGVTIRRKIPVSVELPEGGALNLSAQDNIYLSGTSSTKFYIAGSIETKGDVRLMTGQGIEMAPGTHIKARNLLAYGGFGDIGTEKEFLILQLSGSFDGNTGGSVYVTGGGMDLFIQSLVAGRDIFLNSHGLYMSSERGKTFGYINAGRAINLTSGTDIGRLGEGLRILGDDAVVNVSAMGGRGSIYLTRRNGTLRLGSLADYRDRQEDKRKKKQAEEEAEGAKETEKQA